MTDKAKSDPYSGVKSFIAGGVGGCSLVVVGHPLDTAKVILQTQTTLPGQTPQFSGAFDCLKKTFQRGGIQAVYRGVLPPMIGVAPIYAICFAGYNFGKDIQRTRKDQPDSELGYLQIFNAGCISGIATTAIMTPGERIKCLLQIQNASSAPAKYAGPADCAKQILKESGIRGLYKGTFATLLRDVPGSGAYFAGNEFAKRMMIPEGGTVADLGPGQLLLAGGTAGIFNWIVSLPADTLKSRFQTAPPGKYTGLGQVFTELVRTEGYLALYKGFGPVIARAFPANAACFLGYDLTMRALNNMF